MTKSNSSRAKQWTNNDDSSNYSKEIWHIQLRHMNGQINAWTDIMLNASKLWYAPSSKQEMLRIDVYCQFCWLSIKWSKLLHPQWLKVYLRYTFKDPYLMTALHLSPSSSSSAKSSVKRLEISIGQLSCMFAQAMWYLFYGLPISRDYSQHKSP